MKKKSLHILSIASFFLLSACMTNPDQGVYFTGNSSTNTSRLATNTTVITESAFESCQELDFLRGNSSADSLRDMCISRKKDDYSVIKIVKQLTFYTKYLYYNGSTVYGKYTAPEYLSKLFYRYR